MYDAEQRRDEKTALNQLNQESEAEVIDEVEAFEVQYLKNIVKKEMEEFAVENLKKIGSLALWSLKSNNEFESTTMFTVYIPSNLISP